MSIQQIRQPLSWMAFYKSIYFVGSEVAQQYFPILVLLPTHKVIRTICSRSQTSSHHKLYALFSAYLSVIQCSTIYLLAVSLINNSINHCLNGLVFGTTQHKAGVRTYFINVILSIQFLMLSHTHTQTVSVWWNLMEWRVPMKMHIICLHFNSLFMI